MSTAPTYDDLFTAVIGQHGHLQTLLSDVEHREGEHRQEALDDVRAYLAAHEAMEQEWIHPVVADLLRKGAGHAGDVDHRLEEEHDAGIALDRMRTMDPDSSTFGVQFALLAESLKHHGKDEEEREVPLLRDHPGMDEQIAAAVEAAGRVERVAHRLRETVADQPFLDTLHAARAALRDPTETELEQHG